MAVTADMGCDSMSLVRTVLQITADVGREKKPELMGWDDVFLIQILRLRYLKGTFKKSVKCFGIYVGKIRDCFNPILCPCATSIRICQ